MREAGVQHVITLDLHHMQMQGFFSTPIDNVKSSPLIIDYIREQVGRVPMQQMRLDAFEKRGRGEG